jgi:hypothetical protein
VNADFGRGFHLEEFGCDVKCKACGFCDGGMVELARRGIAIERIACATFATVITEAVPGT